LPRATPSETAITTTTLPGGPLSQGHVELGGHFSRDTNNVYFYDNRVEGADAAAFVVIDTLEGREAGEDSHAVYAAWDFGQTGIAELVAGADPATFAIITNDNKDNNYATDKNTCSVTLSIQQVPICKAPTPIR
jgi:hypothetical protein